MPFLLVAGILSLAATDDTQHEIQPGAWVEVAVKTAKVGADKVTLAELERGYLLRVRDVENDWLWVEVEQQGKKTFGWIFAKHVRKVDPEVGQALERVHATVIDPVRAHKPKVPGSVQSLANYNGPIVQHLLSPRPTGVVNDGSFRRGDVITVIAPANVGSREHIITQAQRGERFVVQGVRGHFLVVHAKGRTGWIYSGYVRNDTAR